MEEKGEGWDGCCYIMCAFCYLWVHSVTRGLSKNMLTCDTQVCTLGSVDNEHRRNGMGTVDQNDAPYGHIAVKPEIDSVVANTLHS